MASSPAERTSFLDGLIRFCLERKLVVCLVVLAVIGWGLLVAPFDWNVGGLPRDPVPVDAIPDIGENQQIVFTEWMGRSPQDVEDQVSYPLTVALLGIPNVKTVRSYSFFGFSSIYIIFDEDVDFYWSRSRVLEKLASLAAGTLPSNVQPALGPDATALGQVFWYTLEGRDPDGNPTGGWGLHELRTIQDWYVRYALLSATGVSEVASIGGFVQEYQIDVDPDAMRAHGVSLNQIFNATRMSNLDVGARTIEVNRVEYVVRGLGFIEELSDIEDTVVAVTENVPITIRDVAHVSRGPALRRGALDKGGAEAVGGVAVVRYGFNPLEAIKNIKAKIAEIASGLPARALADYQVTSRSALASFAVRQGIPAFAEDDLDQEAWVPWLRTHERADWPAGVTLSQVEVVPFYDRSKLIHETLGTLNSALIEEILVTVIVVIVMLLHLRSSVLISALLPLAVLICFIAMRAFGVQANIVALSGIAIAIGTMVDMGVIVCENILRHLDAAGDGDDPLETIYEATREVGSAVVTAVSTTIVSFLPVFTMTAAEGKLFRPLAFTKTFALVASVIVALTIIPPAAHVLFTGRIRAPRLRVLFYVGLGIGGGFVAASLSLWAGALLLGFSVYRLLESRLSARVVRAAPWLLSALVVCTVLVALSDHWLPMGPGRGLLVNVLFVGLLIGGLLLAFLVFQRAYPRILRWCLDHKGTFLLVPFSVVVFGTCVWLGFGTVFAFVPRGLESVGLSGDAVRESAAWKRGVALLPGLGKEFMPPLDEGSYLFMPTTMPHASIGEAMDVLQLQDRAIGNIPEVESVVGKLGRAETSLDPAPISMIETVVNYASEYATDESGRRTEFRFDEELQEFARDGEGKLIPEEGGRPFRQWRDHIESADDIWDEIVAAAQVPGTTSAPRLQPIAARIVMLQSGMRAPMGIKVKGPDLETIEAVGIELERLLKQVPSVQPASVIADRLVGKPYLEIDIDRRALARYGLHVEDVQRVIEVAIGGKQITTTVEGRERYPVRVRYLRELRDDIESLGEILVPTPQGAQIPLEELADIRYTRGPQAIKSEDTFLVGYVVFDKRPGFAEVDVVEECQRYLEERRSAGDFEVPAGISYAFTGSYENQVRSQKTLAIVLPLALFVIFLILYLQFNSVPTALLVFAGVIIAWSGGFLLIWLYGRPGFLDFEVLGANLRDLFQVHPINLSVAIWVGFLALFGIATDDGVVIATYLNQTFAARDPKSIAEVRDMVVEGARRRIRPALMTVATTTLALVPVLTSTGRGSDIMVPMAIPSFGGMLVVVLSVFVVPVLYGAIAERRLLAARSSGE